jgi:hypothetical protein
MPPITLEYRDTNLRPVDIEINEFKGYDHRHSTDVNITFTCGSEEYIVVVRFVGLTFNLTFEMKLSLEEAIHDLARWFVISEQYTQFAYPEGGDFRLLEIKKSQSGHGITYLRDAANNTIKVVYPPLALLPIEEHKLARRIILNDLYREPTRTHEQIIANAHFPELIMVAELNGLRASKYLALHQGNHFLTTEGLIAYEASQSVKSNLVFIIASCGPPKDSLGTADQNIKSEHDAVIQCYKDTLTEGLFQHRFQEHEEPNKNIYVDIFDYIDASQFVVADLTWERPNCYVEIGYALAKQKRVILFIEKSYFHDMMGEKIPFDLFPVRYRTYERTAEGMAKLHDHLEESIRAIRRDFNSGSNFEVER